MNVGKFYETNIHWVLYPAIHKAMLCGPSIAGTSPEQFVTYWSNQLKCKVVCIHPATTFVLLEQKGAFLKVLTADGEVGWIYDWSGYSWAVKYFHEVNQ
jgi:hypothetical protein